MKTAAVIVCGALVVGCAVSRQTYTPEGKIGHSINCSGALQTWGQCYEKAGELCGAKGYTIVAGGGEQASVAAINRSGGFAGPVLNRTMIVQCKD